MPLYNTQSPYNSAINAMGQASGTASNMTKKTEVKHNEPKKTAGGALATGLGGAWMGMAGAEQLEAGTSKALFKKMGDTFGGAEKLAEGTSKFMPGTDNIFTGMSSEGMFGLGGAGGGGTATGLPASGAYGASSAAIPTAGVESLAAGGLYAPAAGLQGASGIPVVGAGANPWSSMTAAEVFSPTTGILGGTATGTTATGGAAVVGGTGAAGGGAAAGTAVGATAGTVTSTAAAGGAAGVAGSTAATGGEVGAAAGPWGAGIGAAVGLAVGLLSYYG